MVVASTKTTGGVQGKVNWQPPVPSMDLNCYPTKQITLFKGFWSHRCTGAFNIYIYIFFFPQTTFIAYHKQQMQGYANQILPEPHKCVQEEGAASCTNTAPSSTS